MLSCCVLKITWGELAKCGLEHAVQTVNVAGELPALANKAQPEVIAK